MDEEHEEAIEVNYRLEETFQHEVGEEDGIIPPKT